MAATASTSPRKLRIALLLCDTPLPQVVQDHGNYLRIYTEFLKDCLASYPDQTVASQVDLQVDGYDVVNDPSESAYPASETLVAGCADGYDAVMLTGSAHTAHEQGVAWIQRLVSWLKKVSEDERKSHLKIIGICFGMQVLSMALGAECSRSPNGWEIGVYDVDLTEAGKELIDQIPHPADSKSGETSIQQFHRDYVPNTPPGTILLGASPKCPVQGFVRYFPGGGKQIRILAFQGHPEFTAPIVNKMVNVREEKGVLDADTVSEARARSGRVEGGEGRGVIGWAIIRVLLQTR